MILAERAARLESEARAARVEADLTHAHATASAADVLIARLKLEIEKLRRTLYGARSERKERLLDRRPQLVDARRSGRRLRRRVASPLRADRDVLAAERLHGDDTTVPILAKGQTMTGRVWVYVRDDRPFGGRDPPAALFYASRDRTRDPEGHLSGYAGILQADAFDGYNRLYLPDRKPGPIVEALCWSHARRKFFELADIAANARRVKTATPISPIALEAVRRIDALFDVEREINGLSAARRLAARQERSVPLVGALEGWMRAERVKLSRHAAVAKAIDYTVTRWPSFTRFLEDGRICLSNNAAERALRGLALGRKSWLFAGSERGAERAALMYTLLGTAKLNDVDPQAWLADVLARIADHPVHRLDELMPWNWAARRERRTLAA